MLNELILLLFYFFPSAPLLLLLAASKQAGKGIYPVKRMVYECGNEEDNASGNGIVAASVWFWWVYNTNESVLMENEKTKNRKCKKPKKLWAKLINTNYNKDL